MSKQALARRFLPPKAFDTLLRMWAQLDPAVLTPADAYRLGGSLYGSRGFRDVRMHHVVSTLDDEALMRTFRVGGPLPTGFGLRLDERVVEYPWAIARLSPDARLVLDAGSVLNHQELLQHPSLHGRQLHIVTLAPEDACHWTTGASYFFHDLRELPIRDAYYDAIICVSTLEHVGADNRHYTGRARDGVRDEQGYLRAVRELNRVLRPGGCLLLSVPFGLDKDYGWLMQFGKQRLESVIETFAGTDVDVTYYGYETGRGWSVAQADVCASVDFAPWIQHGVDGFQRTRPGEQAAAGAVACVKLTK